ncbi:MAG: leucyl aminopeptidase [Acidobacteria bacterium]|nr:leucyl aminopeptidase [Acidobacteriota bacterium]
METRLLFQDAASFVTPLLTVFAVDVAIEKDSTPLPTLLITTDALGNAARRFLTGGEFKAALGETLLLHSPSGLKAERLLIVGLGKVKTLAPKQVRMGAGAAVRFAKTKAIRQIAIAFPEDRALSDEALEAMPCSLTTRALVEGALIADFDTDTYRSDRKDKSLETLSVLATAGESQRETDIRTGFQEGVILGSSVGFTQSLVNEPGNMLTPTELGRRAKAMCDEFGLQCEVHSTDKLKELGMGAFLGVAQGSAQPPALIVMRYEPKTPPPAEMPVFGLVGKGITFDTGGISIKPADGMEKMKYDMAGAAAMIGAMRAIAQRKPACRVISVVCSAENMPGGNAYKPGDVLKSMSGKTIEIINTDAEGRLVLADGLHYAKQLGATQLINAATLTGACVVALGTSNSGLFSNDDATCEAFLRAMERTGENFWRLPCTDDYKEFIQSQIADIRNTGVNRWGGAITAAMFLKEFVGDTPWVHLDIAGQAWVEDNRSYIGKGPSGVAVRTIVEWVNELARA